MKIKTIIITFLILVTGTIAWVLFKSPKTSVAVIACKSPTGNCTYTKASNNGNVIEQKNFDFKDIMQCNIETIHKKKFDDSSVPHAFKFYLYLNNGNEIITFTSKDRENLSSVCSNIFLKEPFELKFKVLENLEETEN